MASLKSPRHERFAQEVAKGETLNKAYITAGYKGHHANASALAKKQHIQERIGEIRQAAADRQKVTVESLIREAEAARVLAMDNGQAAAAVAAIKEKGILSGKRIEKVEQGDAGDFDRMDMVELRAFIAASAAPAALPKPAEAPLEDVPADPVPPEPLEAHGTSTAH